MSDLEPRTLITLATIIVAGFGIAIGTIAPALAEGTSRCQSLGKHGPPAGSGPKHSHHPVDRAGFT